MANQYVGSRIREKRRALGIKQAELAHQAGISPSYLNLIEHNKRGATARILLAIADALEVDPDHLDESGEAALPLELRDAAAALPGEAPEIDAIDAFVGRFPGWARLLAAEARRSRDLASALAAMAARHNHDPFLQESLHEMLTGITAIRASATILATEQNIPAAQSERFQKAVLSESERLSSAAQQLTAYFDRALEEPASPISVQEQLERFLSAQGYAFPSLEQPSPDHEEIRRLGASAGVTADARAAVEDWLVTYAQDAAAMPLQIFAAQARQVGYAPGPLSEAFQAPLHAVFRRLATLKRPGLEAPAFGLVIINAAGHPLYRRTLPEFSPPRFTAICALWPVFQALSQPGQPLEDVIELPNGQQFLSRAIAGPLAGARFGERAAMSSAMLVTPATRAPVGLSARSVGTTCRICVRQDCPARSEPPILPEALSKSPAATKAAGSA